MKISILTPSYNSGKYLERAIQSVLNQDYANWEHIIVDGGSTDNTLNILKKYNHLKWISESDEGQSDAMNKAFAMSTGDIIVYLNADDAFEKEVFTHVVDKISSSSAEMLIGKLKIDQPQRKYVRTSSARFVDIFRYWLDLFPANPVCYFYKRKVQERFGNFPIEEHYTMDYWFLLYVYRYHKVILSEKLFGTFFFSEDNKTANSDVRQNLEDTLRKFIESRNMIESKILAAIYTLEKNRGGQLKRFYTKIKRILPV